MYRVVILHQQRLALLGGKRDQPSGLSGSTGAILGVLTGPDYTAYDVVISGQDDGEVVSSCRGPAANAGH